MQNDDSDILTVIHNDFRLLIDCSGFSKIRNKALRNLRDQNKLLCPYSWSGGVLSITVCNKELTQGNNTADAVFFENTNYPVWFDFGKEVPEYVEIDTPVESYREEFQLRRSIFYGFINYGNEIGKSCIAIRYKLKNKLVNKFKLEFYVLSTKLDYFHDWNIIVRDIEQEYQMLSLSFLQRTYHGFKQSLQGGNPDLIWWNLFNEYHYCFIRAIKFIIERPFRRLQRDIKLVRAEKLKKITPAIEREYEQYRQIHDHKYRTEEESFTNDTPENRFLKYALQQVKERFHELKNRIINFPEFSESYKNGLEYTDSQLKRLSLHPFFRNIGPFKGFIQESMVLQLATGYNEIFRIWLILRSSYSLQDGIHKLETKDIATLYEIWCFITIKNIVEELLKQQHPRILTDNRSRREMNHLFSYNLSQGEHSRIIFKDGKTELAELIYNPKSSDKQTGPDETGGWDKQVISKTVNQKPDIVLRLSRTDYQNGIKLTYLFDAKYRIDSSKHVKTDKGDISYDCPPEDAINQMHRYRDAILFSINKEEEILQKEIIGGYILFPGRGNDEAYKQSRLILSQSQVNIGAFPLRPDEAEESQTLLRGFIKQIINGDTLHILKESIPQKGLKYTIPEESHVFVGIVNTGTLNYKDFTEEKAGLYYTGKTFPSSYNILSFKYFAPYIAGEGIRGYYEITGIKSAKKSEILQNNDSDDSIRFFFILGTYYKLPVLKQRIGLYKEAYANLTLSELIKNSD